MTFTSCGRSRMSWACEATSHPQWRLLKNQLETKGPGWYSLAEREERLFTNRSNRPGDDMKDELRSWGPCGVAGLAYYTESALAITPTRSTLRVSGWTRNLHWHVCPSPGRRTSHFPSIYPQSGRCIYEETKEEEASWRRCPGGVANTAWVSMPMCLLVVALGWSNWEWPLALALGCMVLSNTHSFLEAGVLG